MIGFMLLTRNALLRSAGGAPDFGPCTAGIGGTKPVTW